MIPILKELTKEKTKNLKTETFLYRGTTNRSFFVYKHTVTMIVCKWIRVKKILFFPRI